MSKTTKTYVYSQFRLLFFPCPPDLKNLGEEDDWSGVDWEQEEREAFLEQARFEALLQWFLDYTRKTKSGMASLRRWVNHLPDQDFLELVGRIEGFT